MEKTYSKNGFFSVALDSRTYSNLLYLLLSFPLGIFYFTFLVTGISLGVSLIILFVGLFILYFTLYASRGMMKFERQLATVFLRTSYAEVPETRMDGVGFIRKFFLQLGDIENWKAVTYLFIKFFMGIFNFVVVVTMVSVSIGLTCAPLLVAMAANYAGGDVFAYYHSWPQLLGININPYEESVIYMCVGAMLGFVTLHITNFLAYLSGEFIRIMSPNPKAVVR